MSHPRDTAPLLLNKQSAPSRIISLQFFAPLTPTFPCRNGIIFSLKQLHSSCIHPSLSARASLFGAFDFNQTPITPLGTKIVMHVAADARTTFGPHGKIGWYIGPSPEHYPCWKCFFPDTLSECAVLQVNFFPEQIPFPKFTREVYLWQTAKGMLHLPQDKNDNSPLQYPLSFGPPILNAFACVDDILQRAVPPPVFCVRWGE